ncbi:uncharacterized protein [Pempheris klunzingeri]|uniref:uncharacterized protein n=1 Tax=Pempheris klunzingeri TaxID=3127111 RepID=UPI00397EE7B6
MAEPGRTVRVSGLPGDTDADRLQDKIFIHFLRAKNGGGEIESVTIVKATPICALITFEDRGVAQRVIQRRRHNLEVDRKTYKVTVTEHREGLDPDKVIICLSATVDCSQLPGGKMALTSLHKSHPDVQINCDAAEQLYSLRGAYSKVQAALAQLLPGGPHSAPSSSRSAQTAQRPHAQESEHQSGKPNEQREQREEADPGRPADEHNSGSHRDLTPGGDGWEDTGQPDAAALQLPATSEEDFSLIVDADMFQYLQKHCRQEYQHILSQNAVDVVDMTNQGLTTLFLQDAAAAGEGGRNQERLKLARKAISRFYQENETKIRRSQLPKSILSPRGGLQRAMENLSVRFPKLLLNEDDRDIYIIGSSSDVSEAKQFLLLGHSKGRGHREDAAPLLRSPSYDSGSSGHADEHRVPLTTSSTVDPEDDGMDQLLRSEEDERRSEGARKYKLAARFKDSGLAALGSRPPDFTFRGLSSPSRQTRLGPVLGHDVLSEPAGTAGERVSRASAQNTGGDILFKGGDALPSTASMQTKTSNSNLTDSRPKSLTTSLSTTQLPPAGSGSTLKRARSFSGTPQQKAQVTGQRSQDDSGKSAVRARARSSSFSNQAGRDKPDVYSAEIRVSFMMWQHIKEAYSSRVGELTSDVQMKESRSDGSRDLSLIVRGANSSKVNSCQLNLQKLVDSVDADFSVQELRLSELGVTDTADDTLQACCAEVRSRFKKVTIQIFKKSLYLLGPNKLCSQVGASLREVFSTDSNHIPKQQDFSWPSIAGWNPSTFLQTDEDQSDPQVMLQSQTSRADGTGSSQERRTKQRSDLFETEPVNGSVRKDPVIKEKVKIVETDGQMSETLVHPSKTGNDRSVRHNGVGTTATRSDKDMTLQKKESTNPPEESAVGGLGCICVCGASEKMMTRTKCGVAMCSQCLDTVHVHCRVCHETPRGIQGRMSSSRLPISLPGHSKDYAIKITYLIPDGIQGEGHPSPGKPFLGGGFEAFLPDCERTRKLLPRLEKAFRQGLTFTVTGKDERARVSWDCIPHKISLQGGKSGNGYPDSTYLTRLSDVLTSHGIKESPAKS